MSEITKVKVGIGATREGRLVYYELEATIPPDTSPDLVKAHLEGYLEGWLASRFSQIKGGEPKPAPTTPSQTEKPAPQQTTPTPSKPAKIGVEDVRDLFPKDLGERLEFTESNEVIIVRPKKFLDTENFAKIASIIREAGGEYVSAGRESHFRLAKK